MSAYLNQIFEKKLQILMKLMAILLKLATVKAFSQLGRKMKLNEKELNYLEEHIPELAEAALKQAYWAALASGSTVLMSENGNLVEVFPDGKRRIIKPLPSPTRVTPGQKLQCR